MELRGRRLVLRAWRPGDEDALALHANNRNVWRNLTDRFPHPYSRKDADEWIARVLKEGDPPHNLAILVGNEAVGGVGLERHRDLNRLTAEVGYWLGEAHWGQGLATEAVRLFTEYAFEHFDFERLQASVLEWNPASCRVLEKAGFVCEARLRRNIVKNGQVLDSRLYALLRADRETRAV